MSNKFNYIILFIFLTNFVSCKLHGTSTEKVESNKINKNNSETELTNIKYIPDFSGKEKKYYFLTPEDEKKFEESQKVFINKKVDSEETISAIFELINKQNQNNLNTNNDLKQSNKLYKNVITGKNLEQLNNINFKKKDAGILNLMGLDPFNNTLIKILFHDTINLFYALLALIFIKYISNS